VQNFTLPNVEKWRGGEASTLWGEEGKTERYQEVAPALYFCVENRGDLHVHMN